MTMTDLVADMLTRIRNATRNKSATVEVIQSKLNLAIADVLKREGFITDYAPLDTAPQPRIKVYLKYGPENEDVITSIQRTSTPGRRVHKGVDDLGTARNGLGIYVVSTSKGVLSDRECRKERVGGEILCTVW
jgi:small subunit ribosomal protein S8